MGVLAAALRLLEAVRRRLLPGLPPVRADEGWFDDIERDDLAG
jgi:hypothetical protein